jgi:hypothetical protein
MLLKKRAAFAARLFYLRILSIHDILWGARNSAVYNKDLSARCAFSNTTIAVDVVQA